MPNQTGAIASPRHLLAGSYPYRARRAFPEAWGVVPPKLSVWGNDRYGDCVTAEEAGNIAAYAEAMGVQPPRCLLDGVVISWCRENRFLNGAVISEVMDALHPDKKNGLTDAKVAYFVQSYQTVDWENRADLCSAIFESKSCIKIGIASGCLGEAVQGRNGWMVLSTTKSRRIDHCVGLCGYGPLSYLAGLCGVEVPGNADPNQFCYLMFTWGTVGIVSESAMWAMTGEAWVRNPGSVADPAYPTPNPPPDPDPTPGPTPNPGPLPPLPPPIPPTPEPAPGPVDPCPCPPNTIGPLVREIMRAILAELRSPRP